jgi:hypothetical protein
VPDPQVKLHGRQSLHEETWQSTGQGRGLHSSAYWLEAHALPPKDMGVITDLVRVISPPPHDLEQAEYSDHSLLTQSTGQTL